MEGEYYSHEHPLNPYEAQKVDGKALDRCSACGKDILGSAYQCSQPDCSFHMHKLCDQLPKNINCILHRQHPLILYIKSPYVRTCYCDVCTIHGRERFTYHCSKCLFDLCISCALKEELEHHSHEHPLFLYEAPQKGGAQSPNSCQGCGNEILGTAYHCMRSYCSFQLHKICAQLPRETNHILHHHEKPLVMLKKPPYDPQTCQCDACEQSWTNFTYHCSECDFNLCISCVLGKESEFQHESHQHPLHPLQRPTMFQCDACNTKSEETSYLCTKCPFQIHTGCVSLKKSLPITDHDRELTLAYSLKDKYLKFCKICPLRIRPADWVYCCDKCNYFAHVKCAISESKTRSLRDSQNMAKAKAEEDFFSSLFHLPALPDKYVVMISQFSKNVNSDNDPHVKKIPNLNSGKDASVTGTQNSNSGKGPSVAEAQNSNSGMAPSVIEAQKPNSGKDPSVTITNSIHDHLLIPSEVQDSKEILCDGCVLPISAPFYRCHQSQCSFTLHKCCAELPQNILHPYHKDSLTLQTKGTNISGYFKCNFCNIFCNGFRFKCNVENCNFSLDVKCASLLEPIIHEAHDQRHPLYHSRNFDGRCKACNQVVKQEEFSWECRLKTCDFHLCNHCSLLPPEVSHSYDPEPLYLRYLPYTVHPDEIYCEICEEKMDQNFFMYACGSCDQSFHTRCIHPAEEFPNFKFPKTFKVEHHSHDLKVVGETKRQSWCNKCGKYFLNKYAFECGPCNTIFCIQCILCDSGSSKGPGVIIHTE